MELKQNLATVIRLLERFNVIALVALLAIIPGLFGNFVLFSYIVIFGLLAIAYNICLGETGILTFGHAAFFGLGAYGCGLFLVHMEIPSNLAMVGMLVGLLVAGIGGLVIGALSLRRSGTYLALITLGFAQLLWFVGLQWSEYTGGDDGLIGIPTPELGIPSVFTIELTGQMEMYAFLLGVFLVSLLVIRYISHSTFGHVLNAIRENENRAKFLGYNVYRYKLGAFVLSALFSGVAGTLYAIHLNTVSLSTLHWLLSGEVNFWVLLGGLNSFVGPALGAGIYYFTRDTMTTMTSYWQAPLGLLFMLIVLYLPNGVVPTIRKKMTDAIDIDFTEREKRRVDELDRNRGGD